MQLKEANLRKHYYGVDFLKLFMAICVIAIHSSPLKNVQSTYWLRLYEAIVRQAVPFFFISSGYFLFSKFDKDLYTCGNYTLLIKFSVRFIKLYLLWHLIYLPISIFGLCKSGLPSFLEIAQFLINYVCIGEQWLSWPLWYLLATIYATGFLLILLKLKVKENWIYAIAFLTYIFATLLTELVSDGRGYPGILGLLVKFVSATFYNGRIFTGIGLFSLGMFLARNSVKSPGRFSGVTYWCLITLAICFVFLSGFNLLCDFLLPFASCVLFLWSKSFYGVITPPRTKISLFCRKASTVFYYTHMIWCFVIKLLSGFSSFSEAGLLLFLLMLVLSFLTAILVYPFRNQKLMKILF